jgi:hypothetical protein
LIVLSAFDILFAIYFPSFILANESTDVQRVWWDYGHDGLASYSDRPPDTSQCDSWNLTDVSRSWEEMQFGNDPVGKIYSTSKHLSSHYSLLPGSGSNLQPPYVALSEWCSNVISGLITFLCCVATDCECVTTFLVRCLIT